jgi:hypothetical protein
MAVNEKLCGETVCVDRPTKRLLCAARPKDRCLLLSPGPINGIPQVLKPHGWRIPLDQQLLHHSGREISQSYNPADIGSGKPLSSRDVLVAGELTGLELALPAPCQC